MLRAGETWKQRAADLARKGFSEQEIARSRPKRSIRAKAGHLTEYEEQKRFVKWVRDRYPEHARRLISIENAAHRGSISRASILKAQGMVPGASDLFFRFPCGGFHGLWIEMKTVVGAPTEDETKFLDEARRDGYAACVCRGREAAQVAFLHYLTGGEP